MFILDEKELEKVDGSRSEVNILTRGVGLALLAVVINDKAVKSYTVNFDKGSYSQT